MQRDTVIGIVGVVILVAAMIGVFTYESSQAANALAPGQLRLASIAGPSLEGQTGLGASTTETIEIVQANMTNLTFTLTWTPPQATQTTLRFAVSPSNGTGLTEGFESSAETDGEITLTIPIGNAQPTAGPLTRGVGAYEITVFFDDARPPGAPVAPPQPLPPMVSWTLASSADAWEPAPES